MSYKFYFKIISRDDLKFNSVSTVITHISDVSDKMVRNAQPYVSRRNVSASTT